MKFCAFLLGFLACAVGCSSKDQTDPYATVSEFCEAWGKAACNSTVVSNCSGETTTDGLTQACVNKQQTFCEGLVPIIGYNSAQASRCLDAVKNAYSDAKLDGTEVLTVRHLGDPCNHLIKGPAALGESCTQDDDCDTVHNVLCVMKGGTGTCAIPKPVAAGMDCSDPSASCSDGYFCDPDAMACIAVRAEAKSCAGDYACAAGLACQGADPTAGTNGTCTAVVQTNMCMADTDCASGVCDIVGTATTGACVESIILSHAESACGDLR
ncbi:MAG TPA: hypothetical protein VHV51_24150 [Polyangiaceae bacterium]|nr:hypothetical protein [Polyangiaceae bacterium]